MTIFTPIYTYITPAIYMYCIHHLYTRVHTPNAPIYTMWCKMSNLELGTRIPMIFRAPWIKTAVGVKTGALVEVSESRSHYNMI